MTSMLCLKYMKNSNISHRKNIQEKLGVKTVSALTIYAVMHGLVDINRI